ncbi:MAG: hypothetical protein IKX85_03360, partial [Clostridia bacterium]|nr:hypothetical protein [Clostridia bacterium]
MREKLSIIEDARRPARQRERGGKRDAHPGETEGCKRKAERKRALFRRGRRLLLLPAAAILFFLLFRVFSGPGTEGEEGGKNAIR